MCQTYYDENLEFGMATNRDDNFAQHQTNLDDGCVDFDEDDFDMYVADRSVPPRPDTRTPRQKALSTLLLVSLAVGLGLLALLLRSSGSSNHN